MVEKKNISCVGVKIIINFFTGGVVSVLRVKSLYVVVGSLPA